LGQELSAIAAKAAGVMENANDFAAYSGFNFLVIVDRPRGRAGAYRGSSDGAGGSPRHLDLVRGGTHEFEAFAWYRPRAGS
jgi:hypothetical protein